VVALCALAVTSNHTAATRLLGLVRALQARTGEPAGPAPSRARTLWLSVAAAATATGADFAAALWLVRAGTGPFAATAAGCLAGALVAFALNRTLAFRSRGAPLPQAGRYALVSLTSLALNAGGVSLLLSHPGVAYPIAWWLVRAAVFLLWNYPLLADYVFGDADLGRRHAA
jgi:putative flippase GtrA